MVLGKLLLDFVSLTVMLPTYYTNTPHNFRPFTPYEFQARVRLALTSQLTMEERLNPRHTDEDNNTFS